MLSSNAYQRMRAESPNEFDPACIFFTYDQGSHRDWCNSFRVKAALVYEAVTRCHVNSQTMPTAQRLLRDLAENFECSRHAEPPRKNDEGRKCAEETSRKNDEEQIISLPEGREEMKRTVDAIFLVVGFLTRLKSEIEKNKEREKNKEIERNKVREIVDDCYVSTHTQDVVTDIIKIGNQLPLKCIAEVAKNIKSTMENIKENYRDFENGKLSNSLGNYELNFDSNNLHGMIHLFCWYYSPFHSKLDTTPHVSFSKKPLDDEKTTLLDFLHLYLVQHISTEKPEATGETWRIPVAKELRRSGVRFEADENGCAEIKFQEPVLRIPALVYDFKLATVARNLLAREHEEQRKPVTRYFQLMNELVSDNGDVKVMKKAGVIRGGSRSGQEVLELIKKIDGYATYPSVFMGMDQQIKEVRKFHEGRMKSFLVRNRPGVILASSLAAVSVVAIIATRKKRG